MMFPERVMESLRLICLTVGAVVVVLMLIGAFSYAFGSEAAEYVMLTREDFEQLVRIVRACRGERI